MIGPFFPEDVEFKFKFVSERNGTEHATKALSPFFFWGKEIKKTTLPRVSIFCKEEENK